MLDAGIDWSLARSELQAVLASGTFAQGSRQAKLLEYLFEKLFRGEASELKEYTIAVELFHKPASFDQHSDATVRVEAHRLRKKLQKYYETEGAGRDFRIVLPPGRYVLSFEQGAAGIPAAADLPAGRPPNRLLPRSPLAYWGLIVFCLVIAAVAILLNADPFRTAEAEVAAAVPSVEPHPIPDPEPEALRILVGHTGEPFVDRSGRRWHADRYFEGGTVRRLNRPHLPRTTNPRLFQTVREGGFWYRIPLKPGEYEMRLYWVDPENSEFVKDPTLRFRIMVLMANRKELAVVDLPAETGQSADIRAFSGLRPNEDGFLNLEFFPGRGTAVVSAIEILPMNGTKPRPVRVVAQDSPFVDNQGRFWSADDFVHGGAISGYLAMISGDADPGILTGERIGDFDYHIPVPDGSYTVKLYFGEGWFGPGQQGKGSIGTRIFNVLINNEIVARNLDLLREAPPKRLVTRTFHNVRPDLRGKIHLTFAAVANFASLRAIEVLPE